MNSSNFIPVEMREFDNGVEKDTVLILEASDKFFTWSSPTIWSETSISPGKYEQKVRKTKNSSGAKLEYALLAWTRYQALILS